MADRPIGRDNDRHANGGDQSDGADKDLHEPGDLDFKKAREGLKKIVRENQEWLKEMANR